jgi:hypothetical protein
MICLIRKILGNDSKLLMYLGYFENNLFTDSIFLYESTITNFKIHVFSIYFDNMKIQIKDYCKNMFIFLTVKWCTLSITEMIT